MEAEVAHHEPGHATAAPMPEWRSEGQLRKLGAKATELKDAFGPYMADAKGLRQYLASDLTARGIGRAVILGTKIRSRAGVDKKIDDSSQIWIASRRDRTRCRPSTVARQRQIVRK